MLGLFSPLFGRSNPSLIRFLFSFSFDSFFIFVVETARELSSCASKFSASFPNDSLVWFSQWSEFLSFYEHFICFKSIFKHVLLIAIDSSFNLRWAIYLFSFEKEKKNAICLVIAKWFVFYPNFSQFVLWLLSVSSWISVGFFLPVLSKFWSIGLPLNISRIFLDVEKSDLLSISIRISSNFLPTGSQYWSICLLFCLPLNGQSER